VPLSVVDRPAYLEDAALVARCLRGEPGAHRELYRREVSGVHATLYRVLGPNRDLEDLVQEAFVEIFRSLARFRGEARLATWIDRVTARVAYRWLATKKPQPAPLHLVAEPASSVPAEPRAQAREGLRRLYAILAELPPASRLAFALHAIDGRPIADVARLVGASLVTTKVRIWRARRFVEARAAGDPVLKELLS
jgi:RNA polymerase sigma-70 factor (ECF subfamily)